MDFCIWRRLSSLTVVGMIAVLVAAGASLAQPIDRESDIDLRKPAASLKEIRLRQEQHPEAIWKYDVEAVVGFSAREADFIHLQSGAETLDIRLQGRFPLDLFPGNLVRVQGYSVAHESHVAYLDMEVLRSDIPLTAIPAGLGPGENRAPLHCYCFVEGKLESAVRMGSKTRLRLVTRTAAVDVLMFDEMATGRLLDSLGESVRIEGTLRSPSIHYRQITVADSSQIRVLPDGVNGASNVTDSSERTLRQATVLYSDNRSYFIACHPDLEEAFIVNHPVPESVAPGDSADLYLSEIPKDNRIFGDVRKFASRLVVVTNHKNVANLEVSDLKTANGLTSYQKCETALVSLTGAIKGMRQNEDVVHLHLTSQKQMVMATVALDPGEEATFERGDFVRITGVPMWYSPGGDPAQSTPFPFNQTVGSDLGAMLNLYVPRHEMVEVQARPVLVSRGWAYWSISIILLGALGFVLWNRSLRKQVTIRTKRIDAVNGHLSTSFEAIREAILLSDEQGNVTRVNSRFSQYFGFSPQAGVAVGDCLQLLATAFDDSEAFRTFCDLASEDHDQGTLELSMGERSIGIYTNHVRGKQGQILGKLWAFSDSTDQRNLEQKLLQAQKMEAIGHLTGGIAHDFNNLLTVISTNTSLLQHEASNRGVDFSPYADPIDSAVNRGAELTRQMLDFARNSQLRVQPVNINDLVQSVYQMARRTIDSSINMNVFMHPAPLVVNADTTRLEQVLLNLCINARDAISKSHGNIRIRTKPHHVKGTRPLVCVEVEDDGTGMSEETVRKVFDPFFTTKSRGAGTGLGLSTAIGVIQQLDGTIECESTPGVGTIFRVLLPWLENTVAERMPGIVHSFERGAEGLRLLLVDDEQILLTSGSRMLKILGHEVITAQNGQDAIAAIETAASLDAVLLDLTMPLMSGHEAYEVIRQRWPSLPVIICSGYSDNRLMGGTDDDDRLAFLPKPYQVNEVQDTLAKVTKKPR